MNYRTVVLSSFEEYLASEEDSHEHGGDREARLSRFPYTVMLQVSFPEIDFANRWCWQQFGPCDGECAQRDSEYCVCDLNEPHSHVGKWMSYFFVKTDYNFGFNEWYFAEPTDRDRFLANVDQINWGEHYPE